MHRGLQEGLQERGIEVAQFLTQPELARQGLLDIKAVGSGGIEDQVKAQFGHEQGMSKQKTTELSGVKDAFTDANEEGFKVGTFGVGRASQSRALGLPSLDDRPIEKREEGTIIDDHGIMIQKRGKLRLVKERRCRYHNRELLL